MARILAKADARRGDLVQNAYGYGLFTGGLGFHYGILKLGATVLPTAAGTSERQIALAKELGAKILCCTPTYAAYLGEFAKEKMGIDPVKELKWKSGVFGAEIWSEELRSRIQDLLNLVALDTYGLSEIIGPGVASECVEQDGLHIYEDHFLTEIVDPATGEPVEEKEYGELVITTLTKEAMPLLRYRTGDLTYYTSEECSCGRTLGKIGRILGRTDDMLKIRGAKVWPKAIENALLQVDGLSQNYRVIIDRPKYLDVLTIEVEPTRDLYEKVGGDLSQLQPLVKEVVAKIRSATDVTPDVRLVPVESLPRFMGKAKRVEDLRKKS
jgi:phenylacetate-CoA ligase